MSCSKIFVAAASLLLLAAVPPPPAAPSASPTSPAPASPPAAKPRELAALGCENERALRSGNSDAPTLVRFANKRKDAVRVYWLDFEGKRKHYQDIQPGRSYEQPTYVTHPWVITQKDQAAKCVSIFQPVDGAGIAEIR